jgi:hypothetical protein
MADTFKHLGQQAPLAGVLTDLYVVPALTSTTVSSIVICNQNAGGAKFRISHAWLGAADAPLQYLFYDAAIGANVTVISVFGLTMSSTDKLRCQSDIGGVSFQVYGVEVS